jgi:hypothetical protein
MPKRKVFDIHDYPSKRKVDSDMEKTDTLAIVHSTDVDDLSKFVNITTEYCKEEDVCELVYGHRYPSENITTFGLKFKDKKEPMKKHQKKIKKQTNKKSKQPTKRKKSKK